MPSVRTGTHRFAAWAECGHFARAPGLVGYTITEQAPQSRPRCSLLVPVRLLRFAQPVEQSLCGVGVHLHGLVEKKRNISLFLCGGTKVSAGALVDTT
jgi:hypothetical protein